MASACVNNIGMSPENFYGWLSPRISFSRDFSDDRTKTAGEKSPEKALNVPAKPDLDASAMDLGDFEFMLEDPVTMLPADELFYDGKVVPLHLTTVRQIFDPIADPQIRSPEALKTQRRTEISGSDPYVFSPKAPRCSSRWRELLGLKRLQNPKPDIQKTSSLPSKNPNPKSLKHFLHRNAKSSLIDSSLSLPLLRESDSESVSISSRLSLSSSSSGPDHEDLPRLSLDSEKPCSNPLSLNRNPPRVRVSKPRKTAENPRLVPDHPTARISHSPMRRAPDSNARGVSVDSPRMNSSGKIVFQSLGRSSSSPSSFNGGPRHKIRGVERSYSANVRITPVLNVPVCSLRGSSKSGSVFGLGQLFSPQKKETVRSHNSRKMMTDRI